MNSALREGERIVKEGPANLQKNIEAVGGRLYLTDRRLVFEAHAFNVQGGTTEIELFDIASTVPCWTKFFGLLPMFPNSLAVFTKPGEEYRFVLFDRHGWAAAIQAASGSKAG